jgi:hypothetical protein
MLCPLYNSNDSIDAGNADDVLVQHVLTWMLPNLCTHMGRCAIGTPVLYSSSSKWSMCTSDYLLQMKWNVDNSRS